MVVALVPPRSRRPGPGRARSTRLFMALWPDAQTRTALSLAGAQFAASGRSVAPPNLHMTLAFLGATVPDAVPQLVRMMRLAHPVACEMTLDRYGYFPGARIVWLGCSQPVAALMHYQQRLTTALRQAGFRIETRGFKPHVTLARDSPRVDAAVEPPVPVRWRAGQFALVESVNTPGGVRYRVIESIRV